MKQLNIWIFIITLIALNVTMALGASRVDDPRYLKGYWKLNGTTKDYSGNGNDLVWNIPTKASFLENAYGNLSLGNILPTASVYSVGNTELNLKTSGAYSFWVKTNTPATGYYFGNRDSTSGSFGFYQNNATVVWIFLGWNPTVLNMGYKQVPTHLVLSVDSFSYSGVNATASCTIYENSIILTSNILVTSNTFVSTYNNFCIGDRFSTSLPTAQFPRYHSNIWNFRYYNCALTQAEVKEIYKKESVSRRMPDKSTREPNLVFHTVDGITDLSPSLNTIVPGNVAVPVRGNGIECLGTTQSNFVLAVTTPNGSLVTTVNPFTLVVDLYLPSGSVEQTLPGGAYMGFFALNGGALLRIQDGGYVRLFLDRLGTIYGNATATPLMSSNRYRIVVTKLGRNVIYYINGEKVGAAIANGDAVVSAGSYDLLINNNINADLGAGIRTPVAKIYEMKVYNNTAKDSIWVKKDYLNALRYW